MSFFSKPKAVLWPKDKSVNLYLDKSENNVFSLDLNLWQALTPAELQSVDLLLSQNNVDTCSILIPDDIVFTKSFIYDSEITSIDKAEVIGLAKSFIDFKIAPECLDYKLIPSSGKTIIQAHIFEKDKLSALETNLKSLHLKSYNFESVSQSVAKIISENFANEYFLIYPLNQNEFTLLLAKGDSVYLTSNLKGSPLEVQKIVNYSKLYFSTPTTKFYVPSDPVLEISATSALDKTPFNQGQIALDHKKSANLPLPVLGLMSLNQPQTVIINPVDKSLAKPKNMDNKKNILPFIAVFVITAVIASVIIWFVLNKNNTAAPAPEVSTPSPGPTAIVMAPTDTPVPTVTSISKKIKIQVLNATDINGQATLLKEKLVKLGFTSVAVGNSKDKLTANQLKVKSADVGAYFASQLTGYFDMTPTTDLTKTSTYDAVFYIGTDLSTGTMAPSATTSAAPTAKPTAKVTAKPTVKPTATVTP